MSKPLRVLQLCSSLIAGGAERLVHGLVQHFDPKSVESYVSSVAVVRGNAFLAEFQRLNMPVYVVDAKNLYTYRYYKALAEYVVKEKIDIIHTHLVSADIMGRLVGRALKIPVVSTLHNIPEDYEREKFYRSWLEQLTARYAATHLVAVSESIRKMYIQQWNIPSHKITTIVNGVPMEKFLSVPLGVPPREKDHPLIITNIGRLTPQKAQHIFIEAAKIVTKVQKNVRFVIIGQGKLEQELKDQVQSLALNDYVTFAGVRYDIPEQLGNTDIFVLSSDWEGMPVSAIEAMAAARPVVLTNVGGVPDLVEAGSNGILVNPGNSTALANALLDLIADEPRRLQMGLAARARVHTEFDMHNFALRHTTLYNKVIAEQSVYRKSVSQS
jgi:glycosyltransferase involved in cell wall biosynthesis